MIQMSKLTLRKHFLYKREGVTDTEKISLSSKINKNLQLQKEFMAATNIASYRSVSYTHLTLPTMRLV